METCPFYTELCSKGARALGDLQIEYDMLGARLKETRTIAEIDEVKRQLASNRADYHRLLYGKMVVNPCKNCPLFNYS